MDIQIVHDQVDRLGRGILHRQFAEEAGELEGTAIGCGDGEVSAGFGFHRAEDIGRAAALVFAIPTGFPAGFGRRGRTDIRMQGHRLFVQTDNWLLRIKRALINLQNALHLIDVLVIEVGYGRGRDAGYPAPPAQIPTSGITA